MSFETTITIPADHPCLAGHFPGNPVVPGVVILDHVRMALAGWQPDAVITALPQVKFAMPLLPEQPLSIRLEMHKGKCRFHCDRDGERVAQGELQLQTSSGS